MKLKNLTISITLVTILALCTFNNIVAAAPVSKIHSNYVGGARGGQKTYILLTFDMGETTRITMAVGQYAYVSGVLAYDTPPTNCSDNSHGISNKTIYLQNLNSDGKTQSNVYTMKSDLPIADVNLTGMFSVKLTPEAAGVYTYRATFDGDDQYAPAVSNTVTLTVTNVMIS